MYQIERSVSINYSGGSKKSDFESAINALLSKIKICKLRQQEDLSSTLLKSSQVFSRLQQARLLCEQLQASLQPDQLNNLGMIVSTLNNLTDLEHLADVSARIGSLYHAVGHTLSNHYYQRDGIPRRFLTEKLSQLGVWHDENQIISCIQKTLQDNRGNILSSMMTREKRIKITSSIMDKSTLPTISVFKIDKDTGETVVYSPNTNGKIILTRYQPGDTVKEEVSDVHFKVRVILQYTPSSTRLYLLTAYPYVER